MFDLEEKDTPIEHLDDDRDDVIKYRYTITSYGADYPVDSLVKRLDRGDIMIPEFQRDYVWSHAQASRFVESLLLGLPVPGVFLAKEAGQKHLVIDGQQRLKTLQFFYDGVFKPTGREFTLKNVQNNFEGLTYKRLTEEDRRRLDDSIIHATIIRQEEPSEDNSSIYHVFERLNTGGVLLQPQEIRTCIYHGRFVECLKELNKNVAWRAIYGKPSPRMRDQELILRFFAMLFDRSAYKRPMKEFLNQFMGKNRELRVHDEQQLRQAFVPTIELVFEGIGREAFKPKGALNAAVFDGVMVGLAERLRSGRDATPDQVRATYQVLLADKEFAETSERATADENTVKRRLALAIAAFGMQ